MDETATRILVATGLALAGAGLLAYAVWARRGRSPRARTWMGRGFGARTSDEHWAVLGAPACGVLCLSAGAMLVPVIGFWLTLVAAPVAVLSFLLLFLSQMHFIPLPGAIYPRWARPLRDRNRQDEQGWKQVLRSRRSR